MVRYVPMYWWYFVIFIFRHAPSLACGLAEHLSWDVLPFFSVVWCILCCIVLSCGIDCAWLRHVQLFSRYLNIFENMLIDFDRFQNGSICFNLFRCTSMYFKMQCEMIWEFVSWCDMLWHALTSFVSLLQKCQWLQAQIANVTHSGNQEDPFTHMHFLDLKMNIYCMYQKLPEFTRISEYTRIYIKNHGDTWRYMGPRIINV